MNVFGERRDDYSNLFTLHIANVSFSTYSLTRRIFLDSEYATAMHMKLKIHMVWSMCINSGQSEIVDTDTIKGLGYFHIHHFSHSILITAIHEQQQQQRVKH